MQFDERRYRPLTTADLFDEAFDLYKRNFSLFLLVIAFVVVPATIVSDIVSLKMLNALVSRLSAPGSIPDPSVIVGYFSEYMRQDAEFTAIFLPAATLGFAALSVAVSWRYLEQPIGAAESFTIALKKFLPALWATVLFSIFTGVGSVMMVSAAFFTDIAPVLISIGAILELVALIVCGVRYPLYMSALVNEQIGSIACLKRSAVLTSRESGRIVWTLVCLAVITVVVWLAVQGVVTLLTAGIGGATVFIVPALAQNKLVTGEVMDGVVTLILTPFIVVVITLLYFDMRIRSEGYDMEVLASRLGYAQLPANSTSIYAPALTTAPDRKKAVKK